MGYGVNFLGEAKQGLKFGERGKTQEAALQLPEMLAVAALYCRTAGPADEAVWHLAVAQLHKHKTCWPCHYREK